MKSLHKYHSFLAVTFLLFSFIFIVYVIFSNLELYTKKYDHKESRKNYLSSQWRVPNSKKPISDEQLYTYAGFEYMRGENPILINPEHPPFGKYLIGFSIDTFGNERVFSVLSAILSMLLVYVIVKYSTKSSLIASFGVFLTATQSIFIDQILHAPQLDIFHLLFFLTMSFLILIYQEHNKLKYLILAGISLGFMLSIKVFLQTFIVTSIFLIIVFFKPEKIKKNLIEFLTIMTFAGITFIFTYAGYFMKGGTFLGLLGVQKWIFEFYKTTSIDMTKIIGTYINLILFNKWKFWSDGYPIISFHAWSITWPLLFISGLVVSLKIILHKKAQANFHLRYFSWWIILYSVSMLFIPVFPRYFVLLFVPIIIALLLYAKNIVKN